MKFNRKKSTKFRKNLKPTSSKEDLAPYYAHAFAFWKARIKKASYSDLSKNDIEKINFAFSIYESGTEGTMDAVDLGGLLRALNLNPTLATIEKVGGTKKRGEKALKVDEVYPIYSQVKKEKDQGCFEDFLECLKLYDKNEDGTMLSAELHHSLLALGERLTDAECDLVLKECLDPEDEDGMIKYEPFLKRLLSPDKLISYNS